MLKAIYQELHGPEVLIELACRVDETILCALVDLSIHFQSHVCYLSPILMDIKCMCLSLSKTSKSRFKYVHAWQEFSKIWQDKIFVPEVWHCITYMQLMRHLIANLRITESHCMSLHASMGIL